eukprot:g6014.t1
MPGFNSNSSNPETYCLCTNKSTASTWPGPISTSKCNSACSGNNSDHTCGGENAFALFDVECDGGGGGVPYAPQDHTAVAEWHRQRAILLTSSSLSIIGSFMIIASFFLFAEIRFPSREIIMYISVCDLLTSIAFLISGFSEEGGVGDTAFGTPASDANGVYLAGRPSALCYGQGYLLTFSYLASFLWTACFAFHLLGLFSATASSPKARASGRCRLSWRYHLLSWGLPLVEVLLLLGLQFSKSERPSIGRSDRFWCWISTYNRAGTRWEASGAWLQFGLFYIPLLIIILFNISTYLVLHRTIRARRTISPEMEKAIRTRLQLYLLVFVLCSVWGFANRVVSWFSTYHSTTLWLDYMEVTFGPLQGFLNSIVYGVNTKVLVLFRERFCARHGRGAVGALCGRARACAPCLGGADDCDRDRAGGGRSRSSDSQHSSFDERLLSAPVDGDSVDGSSDQYSSQLTHDGSSQLGSQLSSQHTTPFSSVGGDDGGMYSKAAYAAAPS